MAQLQKKQVSLWKAVEEAQQKALEEEEVKVWERREADMREQEEALAKADLSGTGGAGAPRYVGHQSSRVECERLLMSPSPS